jgi:hypothetical protein
MVFLLFKIKTYHIQNMQKLNQLIQELENAIPNQDTINTSISKSSVGWHIEHCLLVINSVVNAVEKSNPRDYKWKFSFIRILVMNTKKIPRGKARAPEIVQPKEDFNSETLKNHLEEAKINIKKLQVIEPNHYLAHPYFGHLKLKNIIPFLKIHTNHHLHIINDIIKSNPIL